MAKFGEEFRFPDVFKAEIDWINARRSKRGQIRLESEGEDAHGLPVLHPNEDSNLVGLSLSGGGIRSAAFCLGVLQALHLTNVLQKVDYLSTVSGGGYIGASLSAGLHCSEGKFPFESSLNKDEPPSLQHVRDWSNYLFPKGPGDVLRNVSIYARGLVANAVLILLFLAAFSGITIILNPTKASLSQPLGAEVHNPLGFTNFGLTAYFALALLSGLLLWALLRSWTWETKPAELSRSRVNFGVGWAIAVLLLVAFCEAQPLVLGAMFEGQAFHGIALSLQQVVLFLTPFAAAVGFFARQIAEVIKNASESPTWRARISGFVGKAAVWIAAAVVPLLLWVVYLRLSYWGIQSDDGNYVAPGFLLDAAGYLFGDDVRRVGWLYLVVAAALFLLALTLRPNANSLHPLYRDRLSKTFLFVPADRSPPVGEDLKSCHLKVSDLAGVRGPYHIINSALNIQSSKIANRRGRNADFFMFSGLFVGSETTNYVKTSDVESIAGELDLATAMAVSGAAFSSNMGKATVRALTPTLAMLNVRLGYWLRNPRNVKKRQRGSPLANFYYLAELLGFLNERRRSVYITDGGHIENLGIYELLKRRCRVIIAVDAEADAKMTFSSFVSLQRYARIDLGIRIELPWHKVRDVSLVAGNEMDAGNYHPRYGPHCTIGEIQYPKGQYGILIYIKSSLTGDENDYIQYYRQRFPQFPHETTLDQMFSEEQFEVYRALGFHAAYGFFDRRDEFASLDVGKFPRTESEIEDLDGLFPQVVSDDDKRAPGQGKTFIQVLNKERSGAPNPALR